MGFFNGRSGGTYSVPAISLNLHNAFANRICLGLWRSGSNSFGLPTMMAAQRALGRIRES